IRDGICGAVAQCGLQLHGWTVLAAGPAGPGLPRGCAGNRCTGGLRVMLYRPERYYVGLSLPRLMLGNLGVGGESRYDFRNLYHLTAGALFHLGPDFQFRPSVLVTYAESLRPQAEASVLFFVKRVFGLGLNVRSYGELAGMAQFNFVGIGLGYSYQFNPGSEPLNRRISNTTHEIGLSYRFDRALELL